jgi:hypothetical protein
MVKVESINPKKYGKKGYKNQLKILRVAAYQPERHPFRAIASPTLNP